MEREDGVSEPDSFLTGDADHCLLRIAYKGSSFSGFQRQSGQYSIQAFLEEQLKDFLGWKWPVRFCSRTDAGVHALDHCIILKNAREWLERHHGRKMGRFRISLNSVLGPHVVVWQMAWLSSDFSFKKDVLWKTYRYSLFNSRIWDPVFGGSALWVKAPLELKKMKRELKALKGEHDFSAFAKSSGKSVPRGCVRHLHKASLLISPHPRWPQAQGLEFELRGDGFVHHMVRNIVGTIVEIGQGKDISVVELLKSKDRRKAGRIAPAGALTLWETHLNPRKVNVFEG